MTAVDSMKCQCAHSGMTGQVGGFQNPGVCLQAFPSFLPHPLPALLLVPFFARSLTLVPRSLLLNRAETLATQATSLLTQYLFSACSIQPDLHVIRSCSQKNHTIFSGRVRDTGKFKKRGNFLLPRRRKECAPELKTLADYVIPRN